ncbi:mitochondrial outer membrane protein porin 2-like [Durio zibethinus]|uniref:Mitochondrial outer membrane protein porin 2-like n=1 Tax=Durio zibethinus TaxID=66656 RepID=A0A6P6AUS7_DURZI|nr:mitochondrial outer membrane protein porin 2-like [Durio zibethinus]
MPGWFFPAGIAILLHLEVQYFHEYAALTTAVGLKKSPAVDFSATIDTPSITFGASYMTSCSDFAKYNAGVNITKSSLMLH